MKSKICSQCKIEKSVNEFYKDPRRKDGLQAACNKCCNKCSRKVYKSNPEKYKKLAKKWRNSYKEKNPESYRLKCRGNALRVYWPGLTWQQALNEYDKLLKIANFSCALCKKNQSNFKRSLCVDHNHKTGNIRSLLCFRCNKILVGLHTTKTAKAVYLYLLKHDGEECENTLPIP